MTSVVVSPEVQRLGQDAFEARLTQALLDKGLCRPDGLQEALRQQVVLGGHLATNLWELHLVDGKELTRLSAELLGIPVADPKDAAAPPEEVRRLFGRELVERLRLLPLRVVGSVLQVATAEPWDLPTLGRAAFQCGYPVEPHFLAEVPLAALLEKVYGIPTSARFWFGVKTKERRGAQVARGVVESADEAARQRTSLMSYVSSEVEKLRARRRKRHAQAESERESPNTAPAVPDLTPAGPPPSAHEPAQAGVPALEFELAKAAAELAALEDELASAEGVDAVTPAAEVEAAEGEGGAAAELEVDPGGVGRDEAIAAATAAADAARSEPPRLAVVTPPARLVVQPLSPEVPAPAGLEPITTLAEAHAALDAAASRDEVGRVVLSFALGRSRRAVLFARRALLWAGWLGGGEGVDARHIESLLMPTAAGTIFGLVAATGGHFLGPLPPHPAYAPLLAALGGPRPRTAALLPVHFHGRLVFGLYLDGGPHARVTTNIADLVVLVQRVPAALERLVRHRVGSSHAP